MKRTRPALGLGPAASYARSETIRSTARLIEWARAATDLRPDDEYIHELRVRLRRARAVMRAFRRFYEDRNDFERRVAPLRRLSRALGPLRDADVTAALFEEALRTAPYPPRAVLALLARHHKTQSGRWRRLRAALKAVASLEPRALSPPPQAADRKKRGRRLSKHARGVLGERYLEVWKRRGAVVSGEPPTLHELRIEIKRLRYTMEAFDRLLGRAGREWGETLRQLQSTLGLINDHTVALLQVQGYTERETRPLEAAALQRLAATVKAHREWLVAHFRVQWAQAHPERLAVLIRAL